MPVLPIIHSVHHLAEARRVAAVMNEEGVLTSLIELGPSGVPESLLPVIEGSASGSVPVQAWLLPLAALEIEEHHRDRADAARNFVGTSCDREPAWRLLILLDADADAVLAPNLPNTIVVRLGELLGGHFGLVEFVGRFRLNKG